LFVDGNLKPIDCVMDNNSELDVFKYKPTNYKEMDKWLNSFSRQAWRGVLGAYAAGGNRSVVQYLKLTYLSTLEKWEEKDLLHFFACRKWSDFLIQ